MKKFKKVIQGIWFSLKLTFGMKEGAQYVVYKLFLTLLDNLVPLALTIFPGLIINELLADRRITYLVVYVLVLALVPLIKEIVQTFSNRRVMSLEQSLSRRLMSEFYLYILRMDYETLENPDLQEEQERARSTYTCSIGIVDQVIALFAAIINIFIYSFVIVRYQFSIIFLVFVIVFINYLVKRTVQEKMFVERKELDKYDRKIFTITYMFDQQSYGKEFRVFDLSKYLVDKFVNLRKERDAIEISQHKKYSKVSIINAILSCIQLLGLYFIFLFSIFKKNILVGDLSIGLAASFQLSGKLKNTVNAYLSLCERSMYIDEMNAFFNRSNRICSAGAYTPLFDDNSEIEFKDVSFKYPGSSSYALRHLNLKIKANEKLCIVGQNGGGKSTFIKLLTRLYVPCEGEITLNGRNINDYDYALYQKLFAPVFQDFVEYEFSAEENIILNAPEDTDRLQGVIRKTGLNGLFEKLPKGVHTQVGKYIDPEGFEPSGGESQRMAIARALYRGGKIFLLDEPTAALDPLQEYEIYTQFSQMIEKKCAILITHRLSAVQLADRVAVFDNGHVAEYGTHAELYAKGGIYTEMFDKQAQFYRDNPSEQTVSDNSI